MRNWDPGQKYFYQKYLGGEDKVMMTVCWQFN